VDTASSQPGDLVLPLASASSGSLLPGVAEADLVELWHTAAAEGVGLELEEFAAILAAVATKLNYGLHPGINAVSAQKIEFLRGLHLPELALAHACALGREPAWTRFLALYQTPLTQTAIAITRSATLGHELADSLYAELYGLRERDGTRQSPLSSYTGRGSLLGWLRTTLAQRHIDHHRRTHRESPLEDLDAPATEPPAAPVPAGLKPLNEAVARTLAALPAEDRFLLASYFLDRQTLAQIASLLRVHEATISRRLKRLTADLRKQLIRNLQSGGLSRRAAEEALGTDPRDLDINLRSLLQPSQTATFSDQYKST